MTSTVFGLGVALVSALVLGVSIRAYVRLGAEAGGVAGRSVALDVLRALPWSLGLVGGIAVVLRQLWAPGLVEAAGWALALVGGVQFAMEVVARLWLRQSSAPDADDGLPVPLLQPLVGAAVGLGVVLLLAWGLVAGARTV